MIYSAIYSAKNITTALTLTVAALAFAGCQQPTNPDKGAPPVVYDKGVETAPVAAQVAFSQKVDILFVIDNSDSMLRHQETLKANIDRFAAAFDSNQHVDFQIGVVSVFDSKRFGSIVQSFRPNGLLYPVAGHPETSVVTRAIPDYKRVLGETLKIGVSPRFAKDSRGRYILDAQGRRTDGGGPEYEESFSPVVAALSGINPGFPRQDAHLAVIMITDANDDGQLTASQLNQWIYNIKGRSSDNYSTYAVLALNRADQEYSGAPTHILEFIRESRGRAFSLSDRQYGDKLAQAGREIVSRASARLVRIPLAKRPEDGTLKVTVAGTGEPIEYVYDSKYFEVVLKPNAMDKFPADAQVQVDYTPVDARLMGTERVRTTR